MREIDKCACFCTLTVWSDRSCNDSLLTTFSDSTYVVFFFRVRSCKHLPVFVLSWAEHVLVKTFRLLIFKSVRPSVRQEADYNICGCWAEKSKWTTGGLLWIPRAPHPWHLLWVQGLFPISTSRLVITTVAQTPGVNVEACVSVFLCLSVFLCACCKWKKEKKATAELSRTQNKKSLLRLNATCTFLV